MTRITRRAALGCLASAAAMGAPPALPRAGAQTNAWAIAGFDELLTVLGKLKGYGYQGFETSFRNVQSHFENPAAAKAKLAASGLEFVNIHIFMDQYDSKSLIAPWDLVERVARGGVALGAKCLVLSGGDTATGGRMDTGAADRKAEALNRAGKLCAGLGISAAYHNHGPEFAGATPEIERLIAHTDRKLVNFVIDAGHAFRIGANVPAFFARHHGRLLGMHLRDFLNGDQVILGQGAFNLPLLQDEIRKARWSGWLFNEEERLNNVKPGDSAIAPARQHMKKVFGV